MKENMHSPDMFINIGGLIQNKLQKTQWQFLGKKNIYIFIYFK